MINVPEYKEFAQQFLKDMASTLVNLHKNETHCFDLAHEVIKPYTEHFERTDLHSTFDGMAAEYKCNLDSRIYDVTITPRKVHA
jgi:hypothetical protein